MLTKMLFLIIIYASKLDLCVSISIPILEIAEFKMMWIQENVLRNKRHDSRRMKQIVFADEMSHVKAQTWRSKQLQIVSVLEFCWDSVAIALSDANYAYSAQSLKNKGTR